MSGCRHLDQVTEVTPSSMEGCSDEVAVGGIPHPHHLPYPGERRA